MAEDDKGGNILQTAMQNAGLVKDAEEALKQTHTEVPMYASHTTHLARVMELEGQRIADRILTIDAQIAALLAERGNAMRAYRQATGTLAP